MALFLNFSSFTYRIVSLKIGLFAQKWVATKLFLVFIHILFSFRINEKEYNENRKTLFAMQNINADKA